MEIKVEVATTIRLVEISKKEIGRIKESPLTKATKEVVLQVEEEAVVESLTRVTFNVSTVISMVTIQQFVQKRIKVKKVMQSLQNKKKKRCCRWSQQKMKINSRTNGTWIQDAHHICLEGKIGLST